jgi:hypothetical protein
MMQKISPHLQYLVDELEYCPAWVLGERPLVIPLAMHKSMSGWKNLPQASLAEVPGKVRALYARGQRDGVFRRDRSFETLYLTLMSALTSLLTVAPPFLRPAHIATARPGVTDAASGAHDRTRD